MVTKNDENLMSVNITRMEFKDLHQSIQSLQYVCVNITRMEFKADLFIYNGGTLETCKYNQNGI